MDCSIPGFPVFYHLLELAQTHVHWVSDAIQPFHPLLPPSLHALNISQHQGLFQWVTDWKKICCSIFLSPGDPDSGIQPKSPVSPEMWGGFFYFWATTTREATESIRLSEIVRQKNTDIIWFDVYMESKTKQSNSANMKQKQNLGICVKH